MGEDKRLLFPRSDFDSSIKCETNVGSYSKPIFADMECYLTLPQLNLW